MKLLLDENLSRRLVPFLQERYPGSSQVVLVGLERAGDIAIWEFARTQGFVIVSRDSDMEELSVLRGAPPHVIAIKGGNSSKAAVLKLLLDNAQVIQDTIDVARLARVALFET